MLPPPDFESQRTASASVKPLGWWGPFESGRLLGLDDRTFTVPAGSPFLAGDTFTQSNRNIQMVKVGINYLFNWSTYRH
jgi:hypothetical protein